MSIDSEIAEKAQNDSGYAIAYGLLCVSYQLKALGNADASTPMGAIEALGAVIKESNEEIARAIEHAANEIEDCASQFYKIAEKIGEE